MLENALRRFSNQNQEAEAFVKAFITAAKHNAAKIDVGFAPARVLMQDFTGVPAIVDLAAMRDAMAKLGGNVNKVNPLIDVDLVIDHSVTVDFFGQNSALNQNVAFEYKRNHERYAFLKWGQENFKNFRVVPPGTGICHQVNIEYLTKVVQVKTLEDGTLLAYPDTVVGTDSHTTMVNSLGVLGWGVGGIEAEAAMLGQTISLLVPDVVGMRLTGCLQEGVTATDLVLTITQILRKKGVVGKFVEFFGDGLDTLSLADRATISNMAPEYGATCGFFPVDKQTLDYLTLTNRSAEHVALVEAYAKKVGLWRNNDCAYEDSVTLDLNTIQPSLAGPKRPQDKVTLKELAEVSLREQAPLVNAIPVTNNDNSFELNHHSVVIAAITSCTNTSNPDVMVAAGLVAKKANNLGVKVKPWVKTSLAPGSQVVTDYLKKANLLKELDQLGFNTVGYGCTTCIGNSGPLDKPIASAIDEHDLNVSSVLSGNRNFEGRVHPQVKSNYLASPPLVVVYALAGTTNIDLTKDPVCSTDDGRAIYLKDLWPTNQEIQSTVSKTVSKDMFAERYAKVFDGDSDWQSIKPEKSPTYNWPESTYIHNPPYFELPKQSLEAIQDARILGIFGDSVTTDHISPAGAIKPNSVAGEYLQQEKVAVENFNSYGARRGNDLVMTRGTFANIRIKNLMLNGVVGGFTKLYLNNPKGNETTIFAAAEAYKKANVPLVIFAGKEYGTGSSRDWAAKGTLLLGVRAVIVESFERIHRSNLVGMGVLPLEVLNTTISELGLKGDEKITIEGINSQLQPKQIVQVHIQNEDMQKTFEAVLRIDTEEELDYVKAGGILPFVLNQLAA